MDKEGVVQVLNDYTFRNQVTDLGVRLIVEYCLEHGKPENETMVFVSSLGMIPNGVVTCLLDALDYYKRKFEVTELSKIDIKSPKGKHIIKYF